MVGQRDMRQDRITEGPYKGLQMVQGVVVNEFGRAVAYNVMGEKPKEDKIYSARDMIQIFDPRWADQVRGFPIFMHALLDLKDLSLELRDEEVLLVGSEVNAVVVL